MVRAGTSPQVANKPISPPSSFFLCSDLSVFDFFFLRFFGLPWIQTNLFVTWEPQPGSRLPPASFSLFLCVSLPPYSSPSFHFNLAKNSTTLWWDEWSTIGAMQEGIWGQVHEQLIEHKQQNGMMLIFAFFLIKVLLNLRWRMESGVKADNCTVACMFAFSVITKRMGHGYHLRAATRRIQAPFFPSYVLFVSKWLVIWKG